MELVLHIGAHRTGSTLIEHSIAATLAAHRSCGVALWRPRKMRDMKGFKAVGFDLDETGEPRSDAGAMRLDQLAAQIATEIEELKAQGFRRLIISEENLMGGMLANLTSGLFYPDLARRLMNFASLFALTPRLIGMGVRDYGTVWTSAYQYLSDRKKDVPLLSAAKGTLLDRKRGWPDLVEDIATVYPATPLLIWQQERLARDAAAVCATLTGLEADDIVIAEGTVNARKQASARPDLFTKDESRHLRHRYNRHLRRLKGAPLVVWPELAAA